MKIKLLLSGILITAQLLTSCSKDDSSDTLLDEEVNTNEESVIEEIAITVTDFSKTIDENQDLNTVIGYISATSSDGDLTYSITNQSPTGAINIDSATGELTVADTNSFDFETNPSITATVNITVNSITETSDVSIALNDIDDLEYFLSDSKADYTAASDGDWIEITETEYSNLAMKLNKITKTGLTDTEYDSNTVTSDAVGSYTRVNHTTTATIPKNAFTFAFKYKIHSKNITVDDFKVKQSSTSNTSGFSDIGNSLPSHSVSSENEDVFFVLKGNNNSVTSVGYLGLHQPSISGYYISLFDSTFGNGAYYASGSATATTGQWNTLTAYYQGLSSTQKQW